MGQVGLSAVASKPSASLAEIQESRQCVWSIRIGEGYRALALLQGDVFYWFWIGTHDTYERLIGNP